MTNPQPTTPDGAYTAAEMAQDAEDAKARATAQLEDVIDQLTDLLEAAQCAERALETINTHELKAALRTLRIYRGRDGLIVGRGLIRAIEEVL